MRVPLPEPLYLDNHVLVLDKPWGLLTQPSGQGEDVDSLESRGKSLVRERFGKPGNVFLEAVHRIDQVVGGVVLFARTSKGLSRLNASQRGKEFRKRYLALVCGDLPDGAARLEDYLLHLPGERHSRIVPAGTPGALRCLLSYRLLRRLPGASLVEVELETGRHHQIRAQLSHSGHPICGDLKYGASEASRSLAPEGGIALLSWKLDFPHPVTRETISVQSGLSLVPR